MRINTSDIVGKIIYTRAVNSFLIRNTLATSPTSTTVLNGQIDLSVNNSGAIDYTYYRVNQFAGQGVGFDEKNMVRFNVAPAINDYINPDVPRYKTIADLTANQNDIDETLYCLNQISLYYNSISLYSNIGGANYLLGFKGWIEEQNYSITNSMEYIDRILLNEFYSTTYLPTYPIGNIYLIPDSSWTIEYKNLKTGTILTISLGLYAQQMPYVHDDNIQDGNEVTIKDYAGAIISQYLFTPKTECKYDPVVCDFISKYGVWKRIFFYKASYLNIEMKNQDMKISKLGSNQYRTFNTQGNFTLKVNTDWVGEEFNTDLAELMMSENILIDGAPARMKTKATELHKNINNKTINYTLEFDLNTDLIRKSI